MGNLLLCYHISLKLERSFISYGVHILFHFLPYLEAMLMTYKPAFQNFIVFSHSNYERHKPNTKIHLSFFHGCFFHIFASLQFFQQYIIKSYLLSSHTEDQSHLLPKTTIQFVNNCNIWTSDFKTILFPRKYHFYIFFNSGRFILVLTQIPVLVNPNHLCEQGRFSSTRPPAAQIPHSSHFILTGFLWRYQGISTFFIKSKSHELKGVY